MIPVVETKDGTISVASAFAGHQEGITFDPVSFHLQSSSILNRLLWNNAKSGV